MAQDGRHLYTSNRGHDSIAVVAISSQGVASVQQIISSQGATPRGFKLFDDARLLVVANQDSNNVALFKVAVDGSLSFTGNTLDVTAPSFVEGWLH